MQKANTQEEKEQKTTGFKLPRLSLDTDLSEHRLARKFAGTPALPDKIDYEFTHDPALMHMYYQLREEMFISVWGLEKFCGQKDEFDDASEIMIARRGQLCIGGCRLTISTPSQPRKLPMEGNDLQLQALFPELDLQETTYCEFSRLAIMPDYRNGVIFPEMVRRFIKRMIAEGVEYAFGISPVPLARSYRQTIQMFGVNVEMHKEIEIPEREEYEGIKMVLSLVDLSKYVHTLRLGKRDNLAVMEPMAEA